MLRYLSLGLLIALVGCQRAAEISPPARVANLNNDTAAKWCVGRVEAAKDAVPTLASLEVGSPTAVEERREGFYIVLGTIADPLGYGYEYYCALDDSDSVYRVLTDPDAAEQTIAADTAVFRERYGLDANLE